jgi:hypothetical protein
LSAWVGGVHGFAPLATGLPPDAHGMALARTGGASSRLLLGTMGVGVYSKTPHSAWTRLGQEPGDGVITSLLVLPGLRPVVLAGTASGIYRLQWP